MLIREEEPRVRNQVVCTACGKITYAQVTEIVEEELVWGGVVGGDGSAHGADIGGHAVQEPG